MFKINFIKTFFVECFRMGSDFNSMVRRAYISSGLGIKPQSLLYIYAFIKSLTVSIFTLITSLVLTQTFEWQMFMLGQIIVCIIFTTQSFFIIRIDSKRKCKINTTENGFTLTEEK